MDKATEIGTWISGDWGQYAPDRLIDIANDYGFEGNGEGDARWLQVAFDRVAGKRVLSVAPSVEDEYLADVQHELADEALEYMNLNVAAEGCMFDWSDGELWLYRMCDNEEGCEDDECWHQFGGW